MKRDCTRDHKWRTLTEGRGLIGPTRLLLACRRCGLRVKAIGGAS